MGKICVIGPRASGKTTYLAALAYFNTLNREIRGRNYFSIHPIDDDTRKLAEKAQNIILQGASMEPTPLELGEVIAPPIYSFAIKVTPRLGQSQPFTLVARDYSGEFFDALASGSLSRLHSQLVDECLMKDVSGCLLMLAGWENHDDLYYRRILDNFIRIMKDKERVKDLRIAAVISKCERGELWPGRLDPKIDLFDAYLPETTSVLMEQLPSESLGFFALSTFGVLERNDPRPNRVDDEAKVGHSVLRQKEKGGWRPYGMIAPLYWLNSGKQMWRSDA